jgi:hypothetical protein
MTEFELSLKSLSEVDRFRRRQDVGAVMEFNAKVEAWGKDVTSMLRQSVRSMTRRDLLLSRSIRPNFYRNKKYLEASGEGEIYRIGFSFVREGIYIHKGAGRGQGGVSGSKWYNLRGELKKTDPRSLMKMGSGNRKPKEWFNPVIEQKLPELSDIVSDYSASLQIDATNIFIK